MWGAAISLTMWRMVQSYRIRIEAKGYLPVQSPAYPHDGGERVFDARLKRGNWIEGVVRGPDGSPLGEAEVILATGNGIHITGGKEYPTMYYPHVMTGLGGGFAFAPPDGDARVVVLHDRGYAEATLGQLAETHNVRIQPWGRIEGTLRVAGRPLANELIFADVGREPDDPMRLNVHNFNHGKTDQQGRFTIDRLPAGECVSTGSRAGSVSRASPTAIINPVSSMCWQVKRPCSILFTKEGCRSWGELSRGTSAKGRSVWPTRTPSSYRNCPW